jgi:hypothetical protein
MTTKLRNVEEISWDNDLRDVANFLYENLFVSNPQYLLSHLDRKYINIRVDMRTGHCTVTDKYEHPLKLTKE